MIYLKTFNESKNDIDYICRKYLIKNYTINRDGSIDVDGDFNLFHKSLTKLPIRFNYVSGYFDCSHNQLKSLEGSPGWFDCSYNQLITLKFGPEIIKEHINCRNNLLTTLEYCPERVGRYFNCNYNQLWTLKYYPRELHGGILCGNNPLPILIRDNIKHIDIICQEAEDFSIWRRDGTLDERRFKYMMEILKEEGKI